MCDTAYIMIPVSSVGVVSPVIVLVTMSLSAHVSHCLSLGGRKSVIFIWCIVPIMYPPSVYHSSHDLAVSVDVPVAVVVLTTAAPSSSTICSSSYR